MRTLSSHKVQLSQVSSMRTLTASVAIHFSGDKIRNQTHGNLLVACVLHSNCLSRFYCENSCLPGQDFCLTLVEQALVPSLAPRSTSDMAGVFMQLRKGSTVLLYTWVLAPTVTNNKLTLKAEEERAESPKQYWNVLHHLPAHDHDKDVTIAIASNGTTILQSCLKFPGLKGTKMRLLSLFIAGLQC